MLLCVSEKRSQYMAVLSLALSPRFVGDTGAGEDVVLKILLLDPADKNKYSFPSPLLIPSQNPVKTTHPVPFGNQKEAVMISI